MTKGKLLSQQHPGPNMVARIARDPQTRLMTLAERYHRTHVSGQAESTQDAKRRDLTCFLHFYTQMYGHDDAREWDTSMTEAFVKGLAGGNIARLSTAGPPQSKSLSQSTIARTYATVRHFAH
jgi:hypothetical protein